MWMVILAILACLVLQDVQGANYAGADFKKNIIAISNICKDMECVDYVVKDKGEDYELRDYDTFTWAVASITDVDYDEAKLGLASKLYKYIGGENVDNKKIPLILPVVSVYQLDTDHVTVTNLSMWFTLSVKKEQEPAPTDPEVSITTLPGQQYFAAEYSGGSETLEDRYDHGKTLARALLRDERTFSPRFFGVLTYEDITKNSDSHHELVIPAE